ncbi:hypothetical protein [Peptacetobacter hiranonis]|uniref:Uncharacterized protein n=1 Tax=Peptacetobacter hiranonis (strain DSM 13275 / JCM 10541 / KCTC 15199 / TO-931) TaxID=500633 RepID=B6FWT7_PEPHT|nr:hypothetical protein [Peptacetobacter hiranonis]EEA85998.1 hypothetical protein CLOHIR_00336 [Peptacetobacter hiranonis DSM 13275]QEK21115.1 hypothetical protein KGNDJEFE_01602 [Peptacetobacter hiranonis]
MEKVSLFLSIIVSILNIAAFFCTKKEKNECLKIKNDIEGILSNNVNIINNRNSNISSDTYNLDTIKKIDNRNKFNMNH